MKKSKLIVLLISIIIPLIATCIVASYSYKRYSANNNSDAINKFMNEEFLNEVSSLPDSEKTQNRIDLNRKLVNYYYDEEPIYSKEVKASDGTTICVLEVYRALEQSVISGSNETELKVKYEMFAYKVNYTYIQKQFEYMFDDNNIIYDSEEPNLVVEFYPDELLDNGKDLLEDTDSVLSTDPTTEVPVMDYLSTPTKDEDGNYFKVQYNLFRERTLKSSKKYFEDGKGYITLTAQIEVATDDGTETKRLNSFLLKDQIEGLYLSASELNADEMTEGVQGTDTDEKYAKLGYNAWIVKKYVWWQALIALAVSGLIMTGFYFAFTYEEPIQKKQKINKKK